MSLLFTRVFFVLKFVVKGFISLHHYSGDIPTIRGDTMHFSSRCGPFSKGKMAQTGSCAEVEIFYIQYCGHLYIKMTMFYVCAICTLMFVSFIIEV